MCETLTADGGAAGAGARRDALLGVEKGLVQGLGPPEQEGDDAAVVLSQLVQIVTRENERAGADRCVSARQGLAIQAKLTRVNSVFKCVVLASCCSRLPLTLPRKNI